MITDLVVGQNWPAKKLVVWIIYCSGLCRTAKLAQMRSWLLKVCLPGVQQGCWILISMNCIDCAICSSTSIVSGRYIGRTHRASVLCEVHQWWSEYCELWRWFYYQNLESCKSSSLILLWVWEFCSLVFYDKHGVLTSESSLCWEALYVDDFVSSCITNS